MFPNLQCIIYADIIIQTKFQADKKEYLFYFFVKFDKITINRKGHYNEQRNYIY